MQFETAVDQLALLAERKVSSVEILQEFIDQVEAFDGQVNAVVCRDFDRAFQLARMADQERYRSPRNALGSLHGLPMTVKESFDVSGLPTTWGIAAHASNIAGRDAEAVQRLRDAGAIVFAKTNVPEGLADLQTSNPLYGRTNNPWDPGLTCGGSSGGSAAALASGFTSLELGSDLAGSLRTPAHFCGVFSHKPSYGTVSTIGHSLEQDGGQSDLTVVGPMARSAADLRRLFEAIAGPCSVDARGWSLRLPAPRRERIGDYRIAVLPNHPLGEVDGDIEAAVTGLGTVLRSTGAMIDFDVTWPVDLELAFRDYMIMMRAVAGRRSPPDLVARLSAESTLLQTDDLSYRAAVRRTAGLSHQAWLALNGRRSAFRTAWARFFQTYDLVLCPVHCSLAFAHCTDVAREDRTLEINGRQQDYNQSLFWMAIAGLCYLPSTVRPIAMARGLPVGVQIIGPFLEDLTALRFAELLDGLCPEIRYPYQRQADAARTAARPDLSTPDQPHTTQPKH